MNTAPDRGRRDNARDTIITIECTVYSRQRLGISKATEHMGGIHPDFLAVQVLPGLGPPDMWVRSRMQILREGAQLIVQLLYVQEGRAKICRKWHPLPVLVGD